MKYDPEGVYKFTGTDGTPHNGGEGAWPLPSSTKPGSWRSAKGKLVACRNGLHLVRGIQILEWLGPELYVAEIGKGAVIEETDKLCVRKARLIERVDTWNARTARLFACDCAERALETANVTDERSHAAVALARKFANGEATRRELAAGVAPAREAAWAAAWDAARDAPWAAASDAVWAAAWAPPWDAARLAARDAARAAARLAARDAAWVVARVAACVAEKRWQHKRLFEYLNGAA